MRVTSRTAAGISRLGRRPGSFGFDNDNVVAALGKLREMFQSKYLLLGAPKDWYDGSALAQGLTAMQFTGLWTFPDLTKALGDDYGCVPWPAMPGGKKSVVVGAYGSCVSAKSANVDAAKEFVKWLWVDQTDKQLDFATAYGFHIPARASLVPQAKTLQSGAAKDAAAAAQEFGHAQSTILWTPKCSTAFGDMMPPRGRCWGLGCAADRIRTSGSGSLSAPSSSGWSSSSTSRSSGVSTSASSSPTTR